MNNNCCQHWVLYKLDRRNNNQLLYCYQLQFQQTTQYCLSVIRIVSLLLNGFLSRHNIDRIDITCGRDRNDDNTQSSIVNTITPLLVLRGNSARGFTNNDQVLNLQRLPFPGYVSWQDAAENLKSNN